MYCAWLTERVFQQITEVFHLQTLIGTTPQGTVFQFAFCLLLYNLVQVVRAYVATAQARPVPTISTELLFDDVHRQLVAVTELLPAEQIELVVPVLPTEDALRAQLTRRGSPHGCRPSCALAGSACPPPDVKCARVVPIDSGMTHVTW